MSSMSSSSSSPTLSSSHAAAAAATTPGAGSSRSQLRQRRTSSTNQQPPQETTTTRTKKMVQEEASPKDNDPFATSTSTAAAELSSSSSSSRNCPYCLTPLIRVHPLLRLDVGPFIIAYSFLIGMDYYYNHFDTTAESDDDNDYEMNHHDNNNNDIDKNDNNSDSSSILMMMMMMMIDLRLAMTLLFLFTLLSHLALVLSTQWSVVMKVVVGYRQCSTTSSSSSSSSLPSQSCSWTHCYVQSIAQSILAGGGGMGEAAGIVPVTYIIQTKNSVDTPSTNVAIVKFHDLVFRCAQNFPDDDVRLWTWRISSSSSSSRPDAAATASSSSSLSSTPVLLSAEERAPRFLPLYYPIDLPLSFYATYQGHASLQHLRMAEQTYGNNATVLQLPTLLDLLSHQVVAPFFLFQVFCVILWSLDEYWMYALFTLVALLVFESTVAYNRLVGLQRLHRAGSGQDDNQQNRVWVRRGCGISSSSSTNSSSSCSSIPNNFAWLQIPTRELLPGDWICLQANKDSTLPRAVPADILLLSGSAVCDEALLTGESIPQLKQALDLSSSSVVEGNGEEARLDLQDNLVKESILFGGTNLLVASSSLSEDEEASPLSSSAVPHAPPGISNNHNAEGEGEGAVMGMVLRTGFETAQGSLLRTMAHSSANAIDGIHTMDTFFFIVILVACAIFAASLVLQAGWNDDKRNAFRLILHVIMIITSVVPPELPMELSLAVTQSVAALMHKSRVYCTEHFRIPWAGEVKVCCFDKTGTLTSDEMRLRGVRLFRNNDTNGKKDGDDTLIADNDDDDDQLVMPDDGESGGGGSIPWETMRIMVACHALALGGGHASKKRRKSIQQQIITVGNPLEQAVLLKTGFQLAGNNLVAMATNDDQDIDDMEQAAAAAKKRGYALQIKILHRFAFSSKLKRMTVLAMEADSNIVWALTKGAPETLKDLLAKDSIPDSYDHVSFHHMSLGRRVLAMAYRKVETSSIANKNNCNINRKAGWERHGIEQDMIFAGFLVLDCPIKSDSKSVITELRKSGHDNVMITGDAILTACEVARQVGIVPRRPAKSGSVVSLRKKQPRSSTTTETYRIQPRDSSSISNTSSSVGRTSHSEALSNFECVLLSANAENSKTLPLSASNISDLMAMKTSGIAAFCISGDCLVQIALAATVNNKTSALSSRVSTNEEKSILLNPIAQTVLTQLVPLISVFARKFKRVGL
jgi:predicted P-type ATPase